MGKLLRAEILRLSVIETTRFGGRGRGTCRTNVGSGKIKGALFRQNATRVTTNQRLFFFRNSPKLSFTDWNKYLDEIAKTKGMEVDALKEKLVTSGAPGFTGATVSSQLLISNGLACSRTNLSFVTF